MAQNNKLNLFLYEVLSDMEDLERNSYKEIFKEGHSPKNILIFCDKLKNELSEMDKSLDFNKNLISFCSELEPEEEEILFYDVVIPFYEVWNESTKDPEFMDDEEDRIEANSLVAASKIIIEMLVDYFGFDYLLKD